MAARRGLFSEVPPRGVHEGVVRALGPVGAQLHLAFDSSHQPVGGEPVQGLPQSCTRLTARAISKSNLSASSAARRNSGVSVIGSRYLAWLSRWKTRPFYLD